MSHHLSLRTKPTILMGRLAELAGDIAELEENPRDEQDVFLLAIKRTEADRIRRRLNLTPMTAAS